MIVIAQVNRGVKKRSTARSIMIQVRGVRMSGFAGKALGILLVTCLLVGWSRKPADVKSQQSWPMHRLNPERTGYNKFEAILSPKTVGRLKLAWKFQANAKGNTSPAIVDGVLYHRADDGMLYALDAQTGAEFWRAFHGPFKWENGSPAVSDGVVYIGGLRRFWARDVKTGTELWSAPVTQHHLSMSSPAVVDDVVYMAGDQGLYAFDKKTGSQIWFYPIPMRTVEGVAPSLAVANGVVYYGSSAPRHTTFEPNEVAGKTVALDAKTGAELWSSPVRGSTTPAVENGVVYIGSDIGKLNALDVRTGDVRWSVDGAFSRSSPAVANGVIYIGATDHNLYAVNANSGAKIWKYAAGDLIGFSSPVVANGVVYVASFDGNIYAIEAGTGAKLWSYTVEGVTEGSPVVLNSKLYISSSDSHLYVFSLDGHAAADPMEVGCQATNAAYLRVYGMIVGICRFPYYTGATYSAEGSFRIYCTEHGKPDEPKNAVFTSPGYNVPLKGCSGIVSVDTIPKTWTAAEKVATVLAGKVPVEPGPCDATCLERVRKRRAESTPMMNSRGQ